MDRDENQEVDVWWGAYAGRTMAPSFVLCGLATVALLAAAAYLWTAYDLPPLQVRYTAYGLIAALWLVQLLLWGYRTVSLTYRLTTHRLLRDHGFVRPAAGELPLACITTVRVERTALERLLGVGRIVIVSQHNGEPLVLDGVRQPDHIAVRIRRCVEHAQQVAKSCPEAEKTIDGQLRAEPMEKTE
jgi:hypothetical protein